MIAVIFEVVPHPERRQAYLDAAAKLVAAVVGDDDDVDAAHE